MSSIAEIVDLDCVASLNPLRLDLGSSYVTGADAILRRVLYRWCTLLSLVRHAPDVGVSLPLLSLPGSTFAPAAIAGLRADLRKQALRSDFVTGVVVAVTFSDAGALAVKATITLTDGKSYPLEVGATAARGAFATIGAAA